MSDSYRIGSVEIPYRGVLEHEPWRVDWFNALRWFDAKNSSKPRFGTGFRPSDEVLRVSQPPSLQFAPSAVSGFAYDHNGRARIEQLGFGLFGPNGPLPLHLTEHVRSLSALDKDESLCAFVDIFHHRFALLFYRAWASAQSAASLDRDDEDRFGTYVGSLIGYGEEAAAGRDAVPDRARRFMAGHLVRTTRNPEGLKSILTSFFGCPVRVEEWVVNWLELAPEDQSALGSIAAHSGLGTGAVCGKRVPDRRHRFRLHAGALSIADYRRFLPAGDWHVAVRDWVRNYIGFELSWDLRLVLRREEVPQTALGGGERLGWTTWLGAGHHDADRGDLVLDCERTGGNAGAAGASVSQSRIQ